MGGGQQPTTTQTTTTKMSPEQQQMFQLAFPMANQYASTPLQQYSGPTIASFAPEEAAAQHQYVNSVAPTGGALASQAKDAQGLMLDPNFMLDVSSNPYLTAAAQAMGSQIQQNLSQNQLPAIRSNATQTGGMYSSGSSKEGIAEGQAITGTNQAISDSVSKMMFDAYNRGLTGLQGAIQANPGVQAQQLFEPDVMASVGAQKRAMTQAQMDQAVQQFYTGQELPFLQAQELMGLIQGMPGGVNESTVVGSVPKANPLMAGVGGAATGASLFSSLMPGMAAAGPIGGGLGLLASILMSR
jgi:hypothetical protein